MQKETTTDPAGGGQNIGFIEDGDWWSLDPANLTGIEQIRFRAASEARADDRGARRRRRRADRGHGHVPTTAVGSRTST